MILTVPDALLGEYAAELKARFGVELHESRICQILKELDISRKIVVP
jgi:transposase